MVEMRDFLKGLIFLSGAVGFACLIAVAAYQIIAVAMYLGILQTSPIPEIQEGFSWVSPLVYGEVTEISTDEVTEISTDEVTGISTEKVTRISTEKVTAKLSPYAIVISSFSIILLFIAFVRLSYFLLGLLIEISKLARKTKRLRRIEWLRGCIPPGILLFAFAFSIYGLTLLIGHTSGIIPGTLALVVAVTVGFVLPWLLPTAWIAIERVWWKILLRGSPTASKLRNDALGIFELSIRERETDGKSPRSFAFLLALSARLFEFPWLHRDLLREKDQKEKQLLKSTVDNLNEGWRSGLPRKILKNYMTFVMRVADDIEDDWERLRSRCAVANVMSISCDLEQAHELAKENWDKAGSDLVLKWMASYAYFNTTSFRGEFKEGMKILAHLWSEYYEEKDQEIKEAQRELSNMTFNPILAVPRLLILAAAFNGSPINEAASNEPPQYWPWPKEVDNSLGPDDRGDELKWVERWYEKGKRNLL